MLRIYSNSHLNLLFLISNVLAASLSDHLSGERALSFSTLTSRSTPLAPGMIAELDDQYYNIVRISKQIIDGFPVTTAECEHISYLLNDAQYNLVTFVFEGTPLEGLHELLDDTPFSIGVCEATGRIECYFTEGTLNRRNALMRFIDACGCEVEYDGYKINLRKHRGSTVRKTLMDGENVTNLSVTIDSRENIASYSISLFKMADLQAGDEVNITYTPMGINVNTRIVSITYNPFYRYTVQIEVGDYVPNLMASTATQLDRIKQEFRAADGELRSTIETVEGDMSELRQTVSGFDLRIANAEGAVSELSLTLGGFETRITNAEGAVVDLSLTVGGFSTRIESVEGNLADMSLTVNGFNTRIENTEGSISTLSQSLTSITTRVENAEGSISTVSQTADKVNWLIASGTSASNFTMTDRAVSLVADKINLSGYVTITSLKTAGSTTINGSNITTGTISADRIDASTLKVYKLYAGSSVNVAITSSGTETLYIGGDGTWNYKYLKIFADTIQFMQFSAGSTSMLVMDIGNQSFRPNADNFWDLGNVNYGFGTLYVTNISCKGSTGTCGSTSYPFAEGFIKKLYLGTSCYLSASGSSLCVNGTAIGGESKVSKLYVPSTTNYAELNSSYAFLPSTTVYDFSLGSSSYPWKKAYITELYLNGTKFTPTTMDTSKIAYSTTIYASLNASKQLLPAAGTGYYLGNSTYPWQYAYVTNLYINGTKFDPSASSSSGADFAGKQLTMGGSSVYYIICNTSRELRPNSTSTTYPFYLGSASYYWHYAYIGSNTVSIGSTKSSKLGFFGTTPIAKQTLSTSSNNMSYTSATSSNYLYVLNNLVGILKNKYGLIA